MTKDLSCKHQPKRLAMAVMIPHLTLIIRNKAKALIFSVLLWEMQCISVRKFQAKPQFLSRWLQVHLWHIQVVVLGICTTKSIVSVPHPPTCSWNACFKCRWEGLGPALYWVLQCCCFAQKPPRAIDSFSWPILRTEKKRTILLELSKSVLCDDFLWY